MEVIQAKSAGFCFGVARAVKMARELAKTAERPRMLGSVIHNGYVTAELERQGMRRNREGCAAEPEWRQICRCLRNGSAVGLAEMIWNLRGLLFPKPECGEE